MEDKIKKLLKQKRIDLVDFYCTAERHRSNREYYKFWLGVHTECEQTIIELEQILNEGK